MPDGTPRTLCAPSPSPGAEASNSRPQRPSMSTSFRLDDLPHELGALVLDFMAALPRPDVCAAAQTCREWHDRLIPALYASLEVHGDNRAGVFAGLGLDMLTPVALQAREWEAGSCDDDGDGDSAGGCAAYAARGPNSKAAALAHVRRIVLADAPAATTLVEALLTHSHRAPLLPNAHDLEIGPQLFRYIVNTLASFGRPRSGSAFVSEMLVAHLRPRHVRIVYPKARHMAGTFDPVLLARAMTVLLTEWRPEVVEYVGVASDFPPVFRQGTLSRIICVACACKRRVYAYDVDGADDTDSEAVACRTHSTMVRMHLRRTFGARARADLLDAIEEAADPTDDGDIDPDDVPDSTLAHIEYLGVPCIAALDTGTFLDRTFAHWATDVDVAQHVKFFP